MMVDVQIATLNGKQTTIVGVMPKSWRFPEICDIWTPLQLDEKSYPRGEFKQKIKLPAKAGDNSIDVAVIVYDGVLTSDITAPLEVFGNAARKPWLHKINVEAVAADGDLDILTEEGIKLKADRLLAEAPRYDAVIVPSRYGMDAVLGNRALIDFIRDQSKTADWMASNCSGASVLAEAGVLDGKRATTWAGGEASFQKKYPDVLVQHDINVVICIS